MKKVVLISLIALWVIKGFSQGIVFEDSSFNTVLAKAKKENKLVFVNCCTNW